MQISFTANLTVDKDFAKKPPKKIDKENLLRVKDEYQEFIDNDKLVQCLMPNDRIELSTTNGRDGYYLNANFYEEGKEEPFEEFVCISRGSNSQFNVNSLKMFTYLFIAQKSGEQPRLCESIFRYMKRGVMEYIKQVREKQN